LSKRDVETTLSFISDITQGKWLYGCSSKNTTTMHGLCRTMHPHHNSQAWVK